LPSFDGGAAAGLSDISLIVPSDHYGVIEDVHLIINHILVDYFKTRLSEARLCVVV
jgi:D-sedoheptulose 7-phosphate isomerase